MRASWIPPARVMGLVSLLGACRGQASMTAAHLRGATPADLASPVPEEVLALASPPTSSTCAPPHDAADLAAMVARVRRSVVSVIAGRAAEEESPLFEHERRGREHSVGSGMIIARDGLVLTSRHVIEGADDVRVELDDGRSFSGTIVGRDKFLDVALIRLVGARDLPAIELGSSDAMHVGDPVVAIGNPFGLGPSVTRGILSAKARSVEDGPPGSYLQSDALVNPGDSGGPLLDAAGRVIAVNTAILDHGQGISFAVPIDDIRAVLVELLAHGSVARGRAGLSFQPLDPRLAKALGLGAEVGAIVTEVDRGGPSDRAGIHDGDVVVSLEGHAIERASDLTHELGRHKPGEVVRFGLIRAGQPRVAAVQLDRSEATDDAKEPVHAAASRGALGFHAVDADGGGARIASVDAESAAADDLKPGDVVVEVNHAKVTSAADLTRRLAEAPRPSTALLRVKREGSYLYVGVELT